MQTQLASVKNLQVLQALLKDAGVTKIRFTIAPDKEVSAESVVEDLKNYFESKKNNDGRTRTVNVNEYFA